MKKLKVLYIEDEESIRDFNTPMIEAFCPQTEASKNAGEALIKYKNSDFDVIITDIDMPGLNGLEFIETIRKIDDKVRILVTSSYTDKEYLLKAVELRLTKYLEKPIKPDSLEEALLQCNSELEKLNSRPKEIKLKDGLSYDFQTKTLSSKEGAINLKKTETALLDLLLKNCDNVVNYDTIESVVWEGKTMTSNALRSTIKDLRKKLLGNEVVNVSKVGYKFSKSL